MFKNLTPHRISIMKAGCPVCGRTGGAVDGADDCHVGEAAEVFHLEPDPAGPARVGQIPGQELPQINGVRVFSAPTNGKVVGLPDPRPGVFLIVSAMVAGAAPGRDDLLIPGTGPSDEAVRYSEGPQKGQVAYVTRLIRPNQPMFETF